MTGVAIFDLDGVVRVWDPGIIDGAERRSGLPADSLAATAFEPERLARVITGIITDGAWRDEIAVNLETRFGPDGRVAVAQWSQAVGAVDPDVLAVVRQVRRHRPVALLSNAVNRAEPATETVRSGPRPSSRRRWGPGAAARSPVRS